MSRVARNDHQSAPWSTGEQHIRVGDRAHGSRTGTQQPEPQRCDEGLTVVRHRRHADHRAGHERLPRRRHSAVIRIEASARARGTRSLSATRTRTWVTLPLSEDWAPRCSPRLTDTAPHRTAAPQRCGDARTGRPRRSGGWTRRRSAGAVPRRRRARPADAPADTGTVPQRSGLPVDTARRAV